MPNIYLISDTHFSHKNIINFTNKDGTKIRNFDNIHEMNEKMIDNWNNIVNYNDKVYHLGDVVMNKFALPIINKLNGQKYLIKGNHDKFKLSEYSLYFKDIYFTFNINEYILTHIPLHPQSITRYKCNIHGHLHNNFIMMNNYNNEMVLDPRYYNVSVENINYTPILYENLIELINNRFK